MHDGICITRRTSNASARGGTVKTDKPQITPFPFALASILCSPRSLSGAVTTAFLTWQRPAGRDQTVYRATEKGRDNRPAGVGVPRHHLVPAPAGVHRKSSCRHASYTTIATALDRFRLRTPGRMGRVRQCSGGRPSSTSVGRPRVSGPNSSASPRQ